MKRTILPITAWMFSLSCAMPPASEYWRSPAGTEALLSATLKATLELDPGLIGEGYFQLDSTGLQDLNREGIADYLLSHDITLTNLDSLTKHDSTWLQYRFFNVPVIGLEKIETLSNGDLRITTNKVKASDGAHGSEIVLRRSAKGYTCISRKITWIS